MQSVSYTRKQMGDACEMLVAAELTLAGAFRTSSAGASVGRDHAPAVLHYGDYSIPAATNIAFAAGVPRKWTKARAASEFNAGSAA
jgi:hypothetical protein